MDYKTIHKPVTGYFEDRKSRFYAFLVPFDQFRETLDRLRTQDHPKATHHVTAFRHMRDDNRIEEGAKDDGEPSGTSGMPVLKTLIGADLVDIGVIVVRYYGGTNLGGGGLARAYSGAALQAIEEARPVHWQRIVQAKIKAGFAQQSQLETRLSKNGLTVLDRSFTEHGVCLEIEGPEDLIRELKKQD